MTDVSGLSEQEAIKFLHWLAPAGQHNLVAIDPASKAVEAQTFDFAADGTAKAQAWVKARNGRMNLYFSINAPKPTARPDSKLRRDEIGEVRAFAVDLDELPSGYPWGDIIEDYQPSAVVDSGNGKWGFWKLTTPVPVDDPTATEAQNRALAAKFAADPVATNIDRIARLPGTLNIPNDAKRKKGRVESIAKTQWLADMVYEPAQIAAWCAPSAAPEAAQPKADQTPLVDLDSPASVAKAARWLISDAGEAVEGDNGNAATYAVAARLKDFGVSRQTAFDLMLDGWNEEKAIPPWPAADLLHIVKNAFAYGSAAPGRNSPNLAETEFEADSQSEAPSKRKMQAEAFGDIDEDFTAAPTFLIENWYDQETLIVTYGESNSGKTHVVLDQALAIAAGRKWSNKATHQGLVIYVAAEGGKGVRRRVLAHRIFRPEYKNLPFALVSYPINLMHSQADAKALVQLVKAEEAKFGQTCVMVVVDTLSRALAGGDENSSADMGAFVKRCDEIRAATGAALHVIHHAGKNTAKGARGHSLLRAAVDTEIEIENGAIASRKQRDMEAPADLRFDYVPVTIGRRGGRDVVSVVLNVWETTEFDVGRTPKTQKVLDAVEAVITQKIQKGRPGDSPNVTPRELMALGESATTVERALGELVGEGVLLKCKRGLYKLNRSPIPPSFPQA